MLSQIRSFLAAPVFEDEEKTRAARLLNTILLVLTTLTILLVGILTIPSSVYRIFNLLIASAMVAVALGMKRLMRRGHVRAASLVLVCALLIMATATIYVFGGVRGNAASAYFLVIAIAALLLGGRTALVFGLLAILATLGVFYVETSGALLFNLPPSVEFADWFILAGVLMMATFLLRTAVNNIAEGFERARRNAQVLAQSNRELQASRDALETRARELTAERNFIAAVLNTTGALVVVLDSGGRIVRFNRACERATGYSFDEVKGKPVWDLFLPPELVEPVKAVFQELCTRKLPNEAEDYWITKGGDRRLITWSNSVLVDDEGHVEHVIGTGIDITERRRVQEALRDSEEMFRSISASAQDAIIMIDAQGDISYWNKAAQNIFGYTAGAAIGNSLHQLLVPERALEASVKGFEGFRHTGQGPIIGKTFELMGTRKGGEAFPMELSLSSVRIKGEWHAIGIARDITERKRMEEALRESEERYRAATEAALAGISIVDLEENITFTNLAFAEMLGYTQEELVGLNLAQLTDQEEFGQLQAATQQRIAGSRSHYETRLRHKAGSVVNMLVSASPLTTKDGGFEGTLGVVVDISERKQAEERLQRYAVELEQANEEIKQFAYIVSHDLRAPLVNLKGFAAELRAALAVIGSGLIETLPYLGEQQRESVTLALQEDVPEALEFIDASVNRMDDFINAVLKLSRLGRQELKPEPLDTDDIVRATLQTLAHQIEQGGMQVAVGPLPDVVADRTAMEQTWGNLLGNAVKYIDPNRPGEIEISAERSPGETTFHVRDNGRGIAERDMDKVFAPFRRAGKQDVPGEGMGLAFVQTLLRRHGGSIWYESEPGVGTTFTFTIPDEGGFLQPKGDLPVIETEHAHTN